MHRLHSDRHAWPLSSPWWGLPVAPGGCSPGTHIFALSLQASLSGRTCILECGEAASGSQCPCCSSASWISRVQQGQEPEATGSPPHRGGHAAITAHMAVSPTFCHLRGPSFLGFEEGSLPRALVAVPLPPLLPHSHNQPAGLCGERTGLSLDGVPEVARLLHPGWTRAQAGWEGRRLQPFSSAGSRPRHVVGLAGRVGVACGPGRLTPPTRAP